MTSRALGFAGLGPRQVAVRAGQPGLGSALLGQVGHAGAAGAWLGFAGLGPRQGRAAGARLGFAGLGPRQVAAGWLGWAGEAGRARRQAGWLGWGSQGQPGLGLALLGWVLGKWQEGLAGRLASLGSRLAGLAGQFGQAGAAGAAGAQLGFAGLGPRQAGRAGQVGQVAVRAGQPGLVRMGRLGRWGRSVGKGRADQLVPDKDIEGDEGTALGSRRGEIGLGGKEAGLTLQQRRKGRLRFCYIGATVTRIEILISAIDRGGIRVGVIGLCVAASKGYDEESQRIWAHLIEEYILLIGVDGIKWFDDKPDGPGSADSAKDGLKRSLSLEDSGGSIAGGNRDQDDRGGRYIRGRAITGRIWMMVERGMGGRAGKIGREVSQMVLGAIPGWRAGDDDETPPAFR
ncbi:hypothetical protein BY996DRAFT_6535916 [Phakopsora pachyrhizi]|nr:hypothetical protein BY996DRAFT_6535916 [Phakopsora pachyrhizi]